MATFKDNADTVVCYTDTECLWHTCKQRGTPIYRQALKLWSKDKALSRLCSLLQRANEQYFKLPSDPFKAAAERPDAFDVLKRMSYCFLQPVAIFIISRPTSYHCFT